MTSDLTYITRTYYLLTKPGIIMGNAVTVTGGYLLASKGNFDPLLFLMTVLGLSLIIASACVFNNYIDRDLDAKMTRTKNRALVKGLISGKNALKFALALGLMGTSILSYFTNPTSVGCALFGFFTYVILYSFSKTRSIYGIAIGSVAGAMPPVVGYTAASGQLDLGALLFFCILVTWQMPHFYAITIYRLKDYEAGGVPVLPLRKGIKATKIRMLMYLIAFIVFCYLLYHFEYASTVYLFTSLSLGVSWLILLLRGFFTDQNAKWARKVFAYSLFVIMGLCFTIAW